MPNCFRSFRLFPLTGRRVPRGGLAALGAVCLVLLRTPTLAAQSPEELIEAARVARDNGDFQRAEQQVERYLTVRPDDGNSWWMLGQLRYWSGDPRGSRSAYRTALGLRPGDEALRADFARMLVGVGWLAEARSVVSPLRASSDAGARAEAEVILADIRALTPPWVSARVSAEHDDQPRDLGAFEVEAGLYLTPTWTVAARATPRLLDTGEDPAAPTRVDLRGVSTLSSPDGTAGLLVAAGAQVAGGTTEAGYLGRVTLRGSGGLAIWGQVERSPYEWTGTSLDSLLMTTSVQAALDASEGPGWAGALQGRLERFPDDNRVTTLSAWVLAPMLPGIRIGYAASWQDSEESRWERDPGGEAPTLPSGRADTIPGRYAPYHTPDNLLVHTALLEGSTGLGQGSIRAQLSVGVKATEEAPVLVEGLGNTLLLSTYTRSYTPWTVSAGLQHPLGRSSQLDLAGEVRESSYYRLVRVSIGITKRW